MRWSAYALTAVDNIASHPLTPQIAPFVVLFAVPVLFLLCQRSVVALTALILRMFSNLWPWSSSSRDPRDESKKLKKKGVRSRADQLAVNGHANGHSLDSHQRFGGVARGHFPGLVNISGTYCFMDATLQALASLSYLPSYLDGIQTRAEVLDMPTPAVDALRNLLLDMNTPRSQRTAIRPYTIIDALSNAEQHRRQTLMHSRQHQDAQELFQLLSERLKDEADAITREARRDRGFDVSALFPPSSDGRGLGRSVFDGLTANRRSCMQCGYTEAVMHFGFDNWQLALPSTQGCTLEDCLAEYTKLELLEDCVCRRCSLRATHAILLRDVRKYAGVESDPSASKNKVKKAKEARKYELRVRTMLEQERIEDDLGSIPLERIVSPATKQAMIARPPPVLALHLNRSYFGGYASKNRAPVAFPPILDLTPFTTSGQLSTQPRLPLSASPRASPTPFFMRTASSSTTSTNGPRILYSLAAVVCHYGDHSYGHYVSFRRLPTRPPHPASPTAHTEDLNVDWLRASDDDARRVPLSAVLAEQSAAFMLFYERVPAARDGPREMSIISGKEAWPARPDSVLSEGDAWPVRPDSIVSRDSVETIRPRPTSYANADKASSSAVPRLSSMDGTVDERVKHTFQSEDGDYRQSAVDTTAATGARTSARPGSITSMSSGTDSINQSMFGSGAATGARTTMVSHSHIRDSIPPDASASGADPTVATAGSRPTSPARSRNPPGGPSPDSRFASPTPRLVRNVTTRRATTPNIHAGAMLHPAPLTPPRGPQPPLVLAPSIRNASPVPSAHYRRRPRPVSP